MTEGEMRTKLCPFFRYAANEPEVRNNGAPAIYYHEACHGSECLMFRGTKENSFCGVAGSVAVP